MSNNTISNALYDTISKAKANQPKNASDYINPDDGLLYCGKCHTPKQYVLKLPIALQKDGNQTVTVPVACQCRQEQMALERQSERAREHDEKIRDLQIAGLMDRKFYDATFEDFLVTEQNGKAYKLCQKYVDKFNEMSENNQGLLFWGNTGTGKSFTAACIANALIEKGYSVVMTSLVKILSKTQGFSDEENEIMEKIVSADLLILDDLGAERDTGYAVEKVYNIVNSRYDAAKPLIVTTNVPFSAIRQNSDMKYARINDRLLEMCYPIEMTGGSYRKYEANKRFAKMKKLLEEDE